MQKIIYDSSANLEGESVLIDDLSDQMITISPYGRIKLFWAEIFNDFSAVVVVLGSGWKQHIDKSYKPR